MRIAIVNQKGGVGKSSTSFSIVAGLKQAQKNFSFIDCDPQKSLTTWFERHDIEPSDDADYIVIDTPPSLASEEVREEIAKADKIIIVSTPLFADFEVTRSTVPYFREIAPDADLKIVWNKVRTRSLETQALDDYEKALGIGSYKQRISDRACFGRIPTKNGGWNILDKTAQVEVLTLIMEIIQ